MLRVMPNAPSRASGRLHISFETAWAGTVQSKRPFSTLVASVSCSHPGTGEGPRKLFTDTATAAQHQSVWCCFSTSKGLADWLPRDFLGGLGIAFVPLVVVVAVLCPEQQPVKTMGPTTTGAQQQLWEAEVGVPLPVPDGESPGESPPFGFPLPVDDGGSPGESPPVSSLPELLIGTTIGPTISGAQQECE